MERAARRAELEALRQELAATERLRSATDDAYVELLFALGHHALGDDARATALAATATAALADQRADPIHAWILDAFAERLVATSRSAGLRARLDAFDRVARFKVDRFLEAARLLAGEPIDALDRFTKGTGVAVEPATPATLTPDQAAFLATLEPTTDDARADLEEALLEGELEFLATAAQLEQLLPRLAGMTIRRAGGHARALAGAARVAPAHVPALLDALAPHLDADTLPFLYHRLARDHRETLAAVWARVPAAARAGSTYRLGALALGAAPVLADALQHNDSDLRLATIDALLARPFAHRFADGWAPAVYALATDDRSTRSHFNFTAIELVDRLVRGVLAP